MKSTNQAVEMTIPDHKNALFKAVELMGGQTKAAKTLNTSQARIWNWLWRDSAVPAEFVLAIEREVDFQITKSDLRPDIYPRE